MYFASSLCAKKERSFMDNRILFLANAASLSYTNGNLENAKKQAKEALALLTSEYSDRGIFISADSSLRSLYLNILTLLQSIAGRQHDMAAYGAYEDTVKELTFGMFGADALSYYAVHLMDACAYYLSAGDMVSAQCLLEDAVRILEEENGSCALTRFLHSIHLAKLHFHMEQYYNCIDTALRANSLFFTEPLIPPDADGFLQRYAANTELLEQLAYSNLILISCAYGKINSNEDGIAILTELQEEPPKDYYLRASMELALAELYTRIGEYDKARPLCNRYIEQNLSEYPDMLCALASLSYMLSLPFEAVRHSLFTAAGDGTLPSSLCYSRDALQILTYDHGLTLIQNGKYEDALKLYDKLGDKGISCKLLLLALTGDYQAIPECKKAADRYYYRQIEQLFLYYNEPYVYNHLSMLEYHFSFCMDAYLSCYEALGMEAMMPEDIYDFMLNTKYISLEASYLSHHFLTLDALKNRRPAAANDIMQRIPQDTALLEFCIVRTFSTQDYCAFLVTDRQVSCIRIPDCRSLSELAKEWHSLLDESVHAINADMGQMAELANRQRTLDTKLRRGLYRPVKELLAALTENSAIKRLIIAPAGELVQFPFSRLSVSAGNYLGDCYEIAYINTGKELLTSSAASPDALKDHGAALFSTPLIIGNPATAILPPLPYAEKEAHMAAKCLNTVCYTGEDADISLFDFTGRQPPTLLHTAVHGIFCEKNDEAEEIGSQTLSDIPDWNNAFAVMEKSGLVLAGDALLSCNQISGLDLSSVRLAILSACQSGRGRFHAAEGIYGLRRALKLAGCRSVIVSLWQVDDRSGYCFTRFLYENLLKMPENPGLAFSLAVESLRSYEEENTRPFAKDYFWAGYIFIT